MLKSDNKKKGKVVSIISKYHKERKAAKDQELKDLVARRQARRARMPFEDFINLSDTDEL